jgi:hypothetical protein
MTSCLFFCLVVLSMDAITQANWYRRMIAAYLIGERSSNGPQCLLMTVTYNIAYHITREICSIKVLMSFSQPRMLLTLYHCFGLDMQLQDRFHGAKAALFLRENGSHPSCSWFELKFFAVLDRRFGGHSPHTGYATFLASLGIPESIIQAVGQ